MDNKAIIFGHFYDSEFMQMNMLWCEINLGFQSLITQCG